jgi:hypothetical protein
MQSTQSDEPKKTLNINFHELSDRRAQPLRWRNLRRQKSSFAVPLAVVLDQRFLADRLLPLGPLPGGRLFSSSARPHAQLLAAPTCAFYIAATYFLHAAAERVALTS